MTKLRMTIARQAVWLSGLAELRLEREEGQTLAEYALILALIAVVVVVVVSVLGNTISNLFSNASSQI